MSAIRSLICFPPSAAVSGFLVNLNVGLIPYSNIMSSTSFRAITILVSEHLAWTEVLTLGHLGLIPRLQISDAQRYDPLPKITIQWSAKGNS